MLNALRLSVCRVKKESVGSKKDGRVDNRLMDVWVANVRL